MKSLFVGVMLLGIYSCQPEPRMQPQQQQERTLDQRDRHPTAEDTEYLRDEIGIHGVQH